MVEQEYYIGFPGGPEMWLSCTWSKASPAESESGQSLEQVAQMCCGIWLPGDI